jgi:4-hydroxy-tetrahydrodipicolinate synthase
MFRGSLVALATPFNEEGSIDFGALSELIEWHIESGTDGIVLCGTTGEAPTLSDEEMSALFKEAVLIAKGRIPLIAGTGSYDTRKAVKRTEEAANAGVDGALVVVPYYNRPTQEGCYLHFKEVSKVGLPIILYHHPGRTGTKLSVKTLAQIAELPCIAAIKDATGDLDHAVELMQTIATPVLTGDDGLVVPMMAAGAIGVLSIVANIIPREWKILTTLLLAEQIGEARDYFRRYYPLVKAMVLETNPQPLKFALGAMGKCSSALRLPLVQPQEAVQQQILKELARAKLLQPREVFVSG